MRYGYWLPVFGGWLRNVDDENMAATWEYAKKLAQRSEQIGSEANQCAGEESAFVGDTQVKTTIDPNVAPEEANFPTFPGFPVTPPPPCVSCVR